MKNIKIGLLVALVIAGIAGASTIHTFANGEALTAANLNSVLQHIHNTMVGGHGARLVDADVSTSASISQSKIASYRSLPKTWVALADANKACGTSAGSCTIVTPAANPMTVTGTATGSYNIGLGYVATNIAYGVLVTAQCNAQTTACSVNSQNTTTVAVDCKDLATPTARDCGFTAVIFDDN